MRNLTFCRNQKPFFQELVTFLRISAPTIVASFFAGRIAPWISLVPLTLRVEKVSVNRLSPGFFVRLLLGCIIFLGGAGAEAREVAQAMLGNDAAISQSNVRDSAAVDQLNGSRTLDFVCAPHDSMYDSQIIDQSGKASIGCRDIEHENTLISAERIRQVLLVLSLAFLLFYLRRIYAEENVRTSCTDSHGTENATPAKSLSLSSNYSKSFHSGA